MSFERDEKAIMVRAKDVPLTIRDLEMRGRMQAQILPLYLNVLIK